MVSKLEAISAAPVPRPDSLTNKHTNYDDSKVRTPTPMTLPCPNSRTSPGSPKVPLNPSGKVRKPRVRRSKSSVSPSTSPKMTALSGGYGKSKAASQPDDHRLKRRGSGVGLRKINTLKVPTCTWKLNCAHTHTYTHI
eukprot:1380085-Amorphochlora_amoeboformis.AAC.1